MISTISESRLHVVSCPLCSSSSSRLERKVAGWSRVRCKNCSFVFMNPQFTEEALRDLYTKRDEEALINFYERAHSPARMLNFAQLLRRLEKHAGSRGRLLDFGCGAGYFLGLAQQAGWDAHGIDLGRWTAAAAARRGVANVRIGELSEV